MHACVQMHAPVGRSSNTSDAAGRTFSPRAERPNQVSAIDFQFDETADGRRVKLCNLIDEHTPRGPRYARRGQLHRG